MSHFILEGTSFLHLNMLWKVTVFLENHCHVLWWRTGQKVL